MKKVGIVTYYGENYGGMLQAYALQRKVNEIGYECKIISNDFLYKNGLSKTQRIVRALKLLVKNPINYLNRRKAMRLFSEEKNVRSLRFQGFAEKYLVIDKTDYTEYEQYLFNPP